MSKRQSAILKLRRGRETAQHAGWSFVLTGQRIDATTVTMEAPVGKMPVRNPDQSREVTYVWGQLLTPNTPIWIGPSVNGGNEYKGIDWVLGVKIFGIAVSTVAQQLYIGEIQPQSIPASGFVPGRVEPSQLGGLYLHVRPFHYDRGFWDGDAVDPMTGLPTLNDFTVASSVPGTATYARWSIPYLDPATGTITVADGDLQYVGSSGVAQLREVDIEAIVLPDGVYPLDAVGLMYGQTEITAASRIAGGRYHLALKRSSAVRATYSSANVSNPPTTAELTSAFGAPATLGAGFIGVVNDNGAGVAEYLCWSDGASWFYASGTLAL